MSGNIRRALVAGALVAVAVESVATAGWWSWRSVNAVLETRPATGAAMLAESPWLGLPPAVRRARRLPARSLGAAEDSVVIPALTRLGEGQIRWAPADPEGFKNLARAHLIEGAYDEASEDLDQALVRDPMSPELHRLAALNERARGQNEATLEHLAAAEGLASGAGMGVVELTTEDAARVRIDGLRRRLELYPRVRVRGVLALAAELRRRGQTDEARALLQEEAGNPLIELELAEWDLDSGLTSEGEARLEELLRQPGLTDAIKAKAWAEMALASDQRGDPDGALAAANRAIQFDPRSPAPYLVLAGLAERRGEIGEALGHLRRAWGMNPTDVHLLLRVAATAERAGELDDARLALERAIAADPGDPRLRARLVQLLLREGDYMEATMVLASALDRFSTDAALLALAERLRAQVNRR